MPAQKRSSENLEGESQQRQQFQHHHQHVKLEEEEEEEEDEEAQEEEEEEEEEEGVGVGVGVGGDGDGGEDSDDGSSPSSSAVDKDEFVLVKLSEIRKEVQCPICLGIIRKTRTVMECLHRFCRECIDKSMRLGNNECPACRTHCASRRSLRDDPNYDALIAALYPDIDKYEEEELAFHEEEKNRNKQIQASIAQTFRRQSEALVKRRTTAKATAAVFVRKSRRGRSRHSRGAEQQGSDDEDRNGNEGGRDSSSADERCIDIKQKRCKRWPGPRFSHPSSAAANADAAGCDEIDDLEVSRESTGASPGLVANPEVLAWGKGGVRSHTRYGSVSGSSGKNARSSRLTKLVDYFRNLEENDHELDVHLTLVPLDEQSTPSLLRPYLCCRPTLSVEHLYQFIALQTSVQAEDIEILVIKETLHKTDEECGSVQNPSVTTNHSIPKIAPCMNKLQILEPKETLAGLQANCTSSRGHLVLAYRQKVPS